LDPARPMLLLLCLTLVRTLQFLIIALIKNLFTLRIALLCHIILRALHPF
jgi:hypothetical protein